MTTPQSHCPWWCDHHRSGKTYEDEQHAKLFESPDGTWVAIVLGVLPADRLEIAYHAEAFDGEPEIVRQFAMALLKAADWFDVIRSDLRF